MWQAMIELVALTDAWSCIGHCAAKVCVYACIQNRFRVLSATGSRFFGGNAVLDANTHSVVYMGPSLHHSCPLIHDQDLVAHW